MAQIPHADKGKVCPLHQKDVSQVCHKCPWFTRVIGKNPQSNEQVDEWGCAIGWLPVLLIENAQQSRQTGAAVETFRNEMVNANSNTLHALLNGACAGHKLISG